MLKWLECTIYMMKGREICILEKSFSNKLCTIISTDTLFEGNLFVPFSVEASSCDDRNECKNL